MSDNISISVQRCEPCSRDGDDENASGFCVRCIEYLCQGCVKDHRKNKATREHKVLTGDNIPSDHRVYQRIQELIKCAGHTEINVEYKCENCDQFICSKCVVECHRKCEKILDIATIADADTNNEDLRVSLDQMATKITAVKVSKESELRNINQQEKLIHHETNTLFGNIVSMLKDLKDKWESDTRQLLEHISKCEKLDKEVNSTEEILFAVRNAGDATERNVIPSLLKKHMGNFKSEMTMLPDRKETNLEFHKKHILTSIDELGKLVCRITDREQIALFSDDEKAGVSSDEVCDTVPKTANDQSPLEYSMKTPTDKHISDIAASVVLPDGCIVLADKVNRKLKVFQTDFKLKFECSLDHKPIDMCLVNDILLAVISDNSRFVTCFNVHKATCPRRVHKFGTGSYCLKVTRYTNDQILILTSSECYGGGRIELQVRLVPGATFIQHIDVSKHHNSMFNRPICGFHFYNKQLLVTTLTDVNCYTVCGFKLKLEWSQKHNIWNITGIDTDSSGHIYTSGNESYKIERFTERCTDKHIVVEGVPAPSSLAIDSKLNRMIVCCGHINSMYVYQLK